MVVIWWYISDFFTVIFELISEFISLIVFICGFLTNCIDYLFEFISAFPLPFLVGGFSIALVAIAYKILGREGQS